MLSLTSFSFFDIIELNIITAPASSTGLHLSGLGKRNYWVFEVGSRTNLAG